MLSMLSGLRRGEIGLPLLFCAAGLLATRADAQGTMVHTLEAFYAPSAVLALGDGRTLLVANTARGDYGFVAGRGSISRVTLGNDGHLAVDKLRFIEGLNGPVGMTLIASESAVIPAGTLVITVGGTWMTDASGKPLSDDAERGTGLVLFDPATGTPRGKILLGRGSAAESVIGHPVTDPSAIASDSEGNLYLTDLDVAATRSSRRGEANAGLIKIARAALDALVRGESPAAGSIVFVNEYSIATAVTYAPDDALVWSTFGGDLRRLPQGDFSGGSSITTLNKEAGTMSALGVTPKGEIVAAGSDGLMWHVRGRKVKQIKFRKEPRFLAPGQFAVVRGADGQSLLVLPEQSGGGVGPWRQRVNVIALGKDF
jgi:hypothetical protein